MGKVVNPNLKFLCDCYKDDTRGVVLEGSSRSGKTWSSIDFIIWLCAKKETNCTINIIKETFNSFKTTLYDDFNRRLPMFGVSSPFEDAKEVTSFKLFGNKINLLGADKPSKFHGATCDYFYINESLTVSREIFDQSEQRCRKMWWMDYNPSTVKHYIYNNIIPRDDVKFLKTTFIDNPFISEPEKRKILSYEPTPENERQGTADKFMWKVYGLGERSVNELTIFKNWEVVKETIEDYDYLLYGLDFGFTNDPTAIVQCKISGKNLYLREILYKTEQTNTDLGKLLLTLGTDTYIVADSAEPKSIRELQSQGLPVIGATKGQGSINAGIDKLKTFKIFVDINSKNLINELGNYSYKKDKDGVILNLPIDKDNHLIDAVRYAVTKFV